MTCHCLQSISGCIKVCFVCGGVCGVVWVGVCGCVGGVGARVCVSAREYGNK